MTYFCSFASSSSGNCSIYVDGSRRILIDAGVSTRYISRCLSALSLSLSDITHILITHGHNDHVSALPVLTRHTRAQVVCHRDAYPGLSLSTDNVALFSPDECFDLGGVRVQSFETFHDSPGASGFVLGEGDRQAALCTDLGELDKRIFDFIRGSRYVFLESNHDLNMLIYGRYPQFLKQRVLSRHGHLSNVYCAKVVRRLAETGTQAVMLAHLSRNNNTPALALEASSASLNRIGAGGSVSLSVAPAAEMCSPVFL